MADSALALCADPNANSKNSGDRPDWVVVPALGALWSITGANFLFFKLATDDLSPLLVGAIRLTAAGLLLLPFALWRLRTPAAWPSTRQLRSAVVGGLVLLIGGQTSMIWGVSLMPAGIASVFASAAPLFIALFAWLFLRSPLGLRQILGIALGTAGLVLMAWSSGRTGELAPFGAAVLLGGSALWAAGSLYTNEADMPDDAVVTLTTQMLAAGLLLWLVAPILLGFDAVASMRLSSRSVYALAYLATVSSVVGFGLFVWLNRTVSSARANTFNYVSPIIAMLLAAWFFDEDLSWSKAGAAAIALAGVALIITAPQGRRPYA